MKKMVEHFSNAVHNRTSLRENPASSSLSPPVALDAAEPNLASLCIMALNINAWIVIVILEFLAQFMDISVSDSFSSMT